MSNNPEVIQNQIQTAPQVYSDPAAIAAAEVAKARIQAQYIMAINRPRSYEQARYRILEACKRIAFADKVEYSKPVGGATIVGPSIRFAELALREWGNIDYCNSVVYDDENTRRITVVVTDLETNTTFSSSIQLEKTTERKDCRGREVLGERVNSYGNKIYKVRATEDEILTKQAAMISKALRNEGLRLIPQEIVDEAIEVARETLKKDASDNIDNARRKITAAFVEIGIQPKQLEDYLGHPVAMCVPAEIVDLRAVYNALKNGESKWSDFAGPEKKEELLVNAKASLDSLKKKISEKTAPKTEPEEKKEGN